MFGHPSFYTLCPVLRSGEVTSLLRQVKDSRKTIIINTELSRLNNDMAAQQEMRLAESDTFCENYYALFWQARVESEPPRYGVDFVVKSNLLPAVEPPPSDKKRFLAIRLFILLGLPYN